MGKIDGPLLKIERAKKHIADLDRSKVAFLASDPYRITTKFDSESGSSACFLDQAAPIPASIPLIIGDAAHNLRSALDHLVIALVEANNGIVTKQTAFPLCESLEKYESESPRKTEGIRKEAKEIMDRLRPFQGGDNNLWGIHELDRIDKHRVLITVAFLIAKFGLEMGPKELNQIAPHFIKFGSESVERKTYWFDPGPQFFDVGRKQGDPILSIAGNFEENQNIKLTFDIALGEPNVLKGCPAIEALSSAVKAVEDTISNFAPFLL